MKLSKFSFDAYQKDWPIPYQVGMVIGMYIGAGIAILISYPIWFVFTLISGEK